MADAKRGRDLMQQLWTTGIRKSHPQETFYRMVAMSLERAENDLPTVVERIGEARRNFATELHYPDRPWLKRVHSDSPRE
jgi:hypothetical protein